MGDRRLPREVRGCVSMAQLAPTTAGNGNPVCSCGFEFECRPGTFRNFNTEVILNEPGSHVMICPKCGAYWRDA